MKIYILKFKVQSVDATREINFGSIELKYLMLWVKKENNHVIQAFQEGLWEVNEEWQIRFCEV